MYRRGSVVADTLPMIAYALVLPTADVVASQYYRDQQACRICCTDLANIYSQLVHADESIEALVPPQLLPSKVIIGDFRDATSRVARIIPMVHLSNHQQACQVRLIFIIFYVCRDDGQLIVTCRPYTIPS